MKKHTTKSLSKTSLLFIYYKTTNNTNTQIKFQLIKIVKFVNMAT